MKVAILTVGCAKNDVEKEFITGSLTSSGYEITDDLSQAEVIIVNTCGFIDPAKEESIETILAATEYKRTGNCEMVLVGGCLAQRHPRELFAELPEVDGVVGLSDLTQVDEVISRVLKEGRIITCGKPELFYQEVRKRGIPRQPFAYMQISDGCNKFCTYCVIPHIRGRYRSRTLDSLIREAEFLVSHGVKELVLIGQDTASYGHDLYDTSKLGELLKELSKLNELNWIRLLYLQPQNVEDDLINLVGENPKVCSYLDIPFQHASKRIIKAMGRTGGSEEYLKLIDKVRSTIPDVALRTSFIVGFPGEEEDDFEELIDFVKRARFDYAGMFEYSKEEETKAAKFSNQISREVKRERYHALTALQNQIALERNQNYLGREVEVLIESLNQDNGGYQGRTSRQAPEVDGNVFITDGQARVGELTKVRVDSVEAYDLIGEATCSI